MQPEHCIENFLLRHSNEADQELMTIRSPSVGDFLLLLSIAAIALCMRLSKEIPSFICAHRLS